MPFLIKIIIILVKQKDYLSYYSYSGQEIFDLNNKQHFFYFLFRSLVSKGLTNVLLEIDLRPLVLQLKHCAFSCCANAIILTLIIDDTLGGIQVLRHQRGGWVGWPNDDV